MFVLIKLSELKNGYTIFLYLCFVNLRLIAQNDPPKGELHGNFQTDVQYYFRDEAIDPTGEFFPRERLLAAGFANFIYTQGSFSAGLRYENYQNNLLGLPEGFRGEGIPFRFLRFEKDGLDVTVGNYYEQFGSGMIFRSFEERGLGLDNAMDGIRLRYRPAKGLYLKGVIGRQRLYFAKAPGIVRGLDVEWVLNENVSRIENSPWSITLGASFVSKYQRAVDPVLNLPENVGSSAWRMFIQRGNFGLSSEFVYKINDPSFDNGFIFRHGTGFLTTLTYASKGFSAMATAKRIDNMSFRSDRNASLIDAQINFLPPTTKLHTYTLPALYPNAVQPNGEMGIQLEVSYTFKKGTPLGGKYGTTVAVNYSDISSIDRQFVDKRPIYSQINPEEIIDCTWAGTKGYTSNPWQRGPVTYFKDLNIEIRKTINRNLKSTFTYYNFTYNQEVLEKGITDAEIIQRGYQNLIFINAFVIEMLYKFRPRHSLRSEIQGMFTKQDRGDWLMVLAEYSVSPHWFLAVQNSWNYGNPNPEERLHYTLGSMGYTLNTTRFQLNYGRQMRGIFCVGGICRVVPPSNGITMTITTNF
ncbi:DUF6029 family protein [Schleiferia thermophila]|uniref:Uncharacterized protein n=1 Tax=Schleiferia thermophila TaxID=884107 RepID=A0A369A7J0_9FLAO|nr:DUF6029 family protein [Schleiferia thermophila]RCX05322.1 hypothetical protein DES35_101607 [Schleiferia thermophila]GCD79170.1 hypothetical protein JCM30197_04170 [Schleiferia thermophila]